MTVSWPPIMRNPSQDLKRCLGDADMDKRTMRSRLSELGFDPKIKFVITEDLIEAVSKMKNQKAMTNFSKPYKAKSELVKKML